MDYSSTRCHIKGVALGTLLNRFRLHPFILMLSLLTVMSSSVQAERSSRFSVSPLVTSHYGETEYEYLQEFGNSFGSTDEVRSLLEYPLNFTAGGAGFGLTILRDGKRVWQFDLKLLKNLSNTRGLMKDHDWFRIVGLIDGKVSYTESESDLSAIIIDFELQRTLASGQRSDLSILFGLNFQRFEQTMVGFVGWQLDTSLTQQTISSSDSALYYRVAWVVPHIGFASGYNISKQFKLDGKLAFALPFFFDKDRHLLRNFETESDGIGWGVLSRLRARYDLGSGKRQFLELTGELMTVQGSTSEKQTYYGDDPGTPEDETGLIYIGIPHALRSTQFRIGLNITFAL